MARRTKAIAAAGASRERQDAPPHLEPLRIFLQTWAISNDTRVPVDRLSSAKEVDRFRARHFKFLPLRGTSREEFAGLRDLRDDLRRALQADEAIKIEIMKPWLRRLPVGVELAGVHGKGTEGDSRPLRYRYLGKRDQLAGAILALFVEAVASGEWRRLKICPDCQTVFYDRTKPKNRVWCGMSAHGPGGRACGSIAKVRSYRARQRSRGVALRQASDASQSRAR